MSIFTTLARGQCDYRNPNSLAVRFRRRRARHLLSLLQRCYALQHKVDIIDIGGRSSYWDILPVDLFERLQMSVLLVNDEQELQGQHQAKGSNPRAAYIRSYTGDGRDLSGFGDNHFDLVHSNSVIEHVGEWRHMRTLAAEIKRLAPAYYVQTPGFWFPFEPHFLAPIYHWLPEPWRVSLLLKRRLGHMSRQATVSDAVEVVQSVHLLDKKMLQSLFPEAEIVHERLLGLTKSHTAILMPSPRQ